MKFRTLLVTTTALTIAMGNILIAPAQAVSKYSIKCTSPGVVKVAKPGQAIYASLNFMVNGNYVGYTNYYLLTDYPIGYPTLDGATKVIVKLDTDPNTVTYLYEVGIGCR